jgi:hypothetical protein
VGTVVSFENHDHSDAVIISDYPFEESVPPEEVLEVSFTKTGTFQFWLETAPNNKGTITVIE